MGIAGNMCNILKRGGSTPTLASISPTTSVAGEAQLVTLTGTKFEPDSIVTVNGVEVPATYVSPTSMTSPVVLTDPAGTYDYRVTTEGKTSTVARIYTLTEPEEP